MVALHMEACSFHINAVLLTRLFMWISSFVVLEQMRLLKKVPKYHNLPTVGQMVELLR